MNTIKLYGHSDDCIEVDGLVKGCDEFGGDRAVVVCVPTGDRFLVRYGEDGRPVWRVTHEHVSRQLVVDIEQVPDGDNPDPYTDRATVSGPIDNVEIWRHWPPRTQEIRDRLERYLESGLDDEETVRVWETLGRP